MREGLAREDAPAPMGIAVARVQLQSTRRDNYPEVHGVVHLARPHGGMGKGMLTRWALAGVVLLVAYLARDVMAPFVVAGTLAYIFSPLVDEIEERTHLPRLAIVGVIYVVLLSALGGGIWF